MNTVEVRGLTKVFEGGIHALRGIDFHIKDGEIFGLLGPNGAGKTTTINILATLLKQTSGEAVVNGFDCLEEPHKVRQSIGIVFQDPSSDDMLTGRENLHLHGLMYGLRKAEREKRIEEVLRLVELTDRADDRVRRYSGGMRRRLELARGLLHKPKVLFLDEPTLGLDPQSREHVWRYIGGLVDEGGLSILLTTHYMEEAEKLCHRVAIIDRGKIIVLDTPKGLTESVGGDVVALKTGNPDVTALAEKEYVLSIEQKEGLLTLTVRDAKQNLPEILRLAGRVESVEMHSPTLNDVFLHYTGREIREGPEEGGYGTRMMMSVKRR
ncbi:MAG: ATP-binding cassette domain-containing protein [Methanobacteriota archaeon]|nr:MAG: ATP-binding cassette domain-containing protein [Euryarchaeota archaeon]